MADKQDAQTNASGAGGGIAAPGDTVLAAMTAATAGAIAVPLDPATIDAGLARLDAFVTSLMPKMPRPPKADMCPSTDPLIAPHCHQLALDESKAEFKYGNARAAAIATFQGELNNWAQAQSQYRFALGNAQVALAAAVKQATDAFTAKNNLDSHSRSEFLYFTMKEAVATAVAAYQASAVTAAQALASEAGAVISAQAAFLGAVAVAQGGMESDQAAAQQSFWQGIETDRDAV
ncbi:MAG: hypothetical protein E7773_07885 [Sphingomonas sp.]|uniref:hypothetical protein n=1 Tax=Sphingomonas sp. TaxID=28214 RepID=UPI00120AD668|nr:hypothetical protein [Sphingomonas sp.]THD35860.1 MAG: hypothetical protein E7773_07885 [Sphingomonas sp.]